jgi:hypothetical protein
MASTVPFNPVSLEKATEKPFEIFSLIWLDTEATVQGTRNGDERLRSIINNLQRFHEIKPCQQYIESSSEYDRLVLVVSGQLGKELVPKIDKLRQVIAIYVYCMNVEAHETWAKPRPKVGSCHWFLRLNSSHVSLP